MTPFSVRRRFGSRRLVNPLGYADFGFATADEAEPGEGEGAGATANGTEAKMEVKLTSRQVNNSSFVSETKIQGFMITRSVGFSGI